MMSVEILGTYTGPLYTIRTTKIDNGISVISRIFANLGQERVGGAGDFEAV